MLETYTYKPKQSDYAFYNDFYKDELPIRTKALQDLRDTLDPEKSAEGWQKVEEGLNSKDRKVARVTRSYFSHALAYNNLSDATGSWEDYSEGITPSDKWLKQGIALAVKDTCKEWLSPNEPASLRFIPFQRGLIQYDETRPEIADAFLEGLAVVAETAKDPMMRTAACSAIGYVATETSIWTKATDRLGHDPRPNRFAVPAMEFIVDKAQDSKAATSLREEAISKLVLRVGDRGFRSSLYNHDLTPNRQQHLDQDPATHNAYDALAGLLKEGDAKGQEITENLVDVPLVLRLSHLKPKEAKTQQFKGESPLLTSLNGQAFKTNPGIAPSGP